MPELSDLVMDDDLPAPMEVIKPDQVLMPGHLGGLEVRPVDLTKPYVNMLIYGDSGVGKTRLAGSAGEVPEMCPVLFIDVEGGTFSLRGLYDDVAVIRTTDFLQIQKVYDALYEGKHPFKTVVLDSLTEMQKFSMYGIMERLVSSGAKNQDGSPRDPDIPGLREWGQNTEQIRKMVRAFRDLPMNVIFTALAKADRNPRTGETTTMPSLSGKLGAEVQGFLDVVAYYYIQRVPIEGSDQVENKRLLLTSNTGTHIAKDRSDNLPLVVPDPTMRVLTDYIHRVPREHDNKDND